MVVVVVEVVVGGGYWNLCPSVNVSKFVQTICPESLNDFLSNLVWLCIIIRWAAMQKNWFTIFKVTARAYSYKIKM